MRDTECDNVTHRATERATERDTEREISPWHDIPLFDSTSSGTDGTLNFICEIPKWTRPKMEVATGEQYNPIKQDTKNGLVRSYGVFPLFNYGAFPQTWEDPAHTSEDTGCIVRSHTLHTCACLVLVAG